MRPPADSEAAVSPYIHALDGIRALAILLVIPHNIDLLHPPYSAAVWPAVMLTHAGWIGVQLFFVLSGFLITGNLLDTQRAGNYYSAFIARRTLRILPLYFGMLLLALVLVPLVVTPPQDLQDTLHNQVWLWTFLSNWTAPSGGTVTGFSHYWSLAVEEQFYLLWPFVVARCRPITLLKVCGAIVLAALATRLMMMHAHASDNALYMITPARMDALALGAAAAALVRIPSAYSRLQRITWGIAAAALILLLVDLLLTDGYISSNHRAQEYGYTLLALGFALIVLLAALPTSGILRASFSGLCFRPLRLVGRYSYGMYIFHLPLHVYIGNALLHHFVTDVSPGIAVAYAFASIVVNFALAAASYELYERHFLSLKRFFMPQRPDARTAAVPAPPQ
jgi:peptidoglycan/LPS O-acetylase OafA/YrhL